MGTWYHGTPEETRALDAYIKMSRGMGSVASYIERKSPLPDNLTPSQFMALEVLLHRGPLLQCEIGRKILKTAGNITMVVDHLEKAGLVRRLRLETDRRGISVDLTDQGRALIRSYFPRRAAAITEAFSVLTPEEQEILSRLCKKLGLGTERLSRIPRSGSAQSGSQKIMEG